MAKGQHKTCGWWATNKDAPNGWGKAGLRQKRCKGRRVRQRKIGGRRVGGEIAPFRHSLGGLVVLEGLLPARLDGEQHFIDILVDFFGELYQ